MQSMGFDLSEAKNHCSTAGEILNDPLVGSLEHDFYDFP